MKRIAFIKDGKVTAVLNCDPSLLEAILGADVQLEATTEDPQLTTGWDYDGAVFIAPEAVVE